MAVEDHLTKGYTKDPGDKQKSNIIPPEILFAYQKEQARLSPDGQQLAYLGPSPDHVLNVWVRPLHGTDEEAKMITAETHRGVMQRTSTYNWKSCISMRALILVSVLHQCLSIYLLTLQISLLQMTF